MLDFILIVVALAISAMIVGVCVTIIVCLIFEGV